MATTHSVNPANSVLVRTSLSFLPALGHLAEALRRRRIRRNYGDMSDAQLRDIGLTRWDLEVALSLPLERDAGDALAVAAEIEAKRW